MELKWFFDFLRRINVYLCCRNHWYVSTTIPMKMKKCWCVSREIEMFLRRINVYLCCRNHWYVSTTKPMKMKKCRCVSHGIEMIFWDAWMFVYVAGIIDTSLQQYQWKWKNVDASLMELKWFFETHQCLFMLQESLIRLYGWDGAININHHLSNWKCFVRYNLFLICILLDFLLFCREIYLAKQMWFCI